MSNDPETSDEGPVKPPRKPRRKSRQPREDESLRDAVLKRLEQLGMSQRRFALLIGIQPSHFNSIIQRRRAPGIANARKIASALGYTLDELFTEERAK